MNKPSWKSLPGFLLAIAAGMCIAIGGIALLNIDNPVAGAFLFSIGLLTICMFGFNLYTGKVCYFVEHPSLSYLFWLFSVWIGNFVGANLVAWAYHFTTGYTKVMDRVQTLVQAKCDSSLLSIFILACFCGIMIYIAVQGFKEATSGTLKVASIILGVMVFILCGFEHSIANMFYFALAQNYSGQAFLILLVMSLGNAVGGMFFPFLRKLSNK